jgi:hypothetical protein
MEFSKDVPLCQLRDDYVWVGWRKAVGGIPADVEQCSRLKDVFYIPSLQDIHILLFFQSVSFLSKGFNVLIFLLHL